MLKLTTSIKVQSDDWSDIMKELQNPEADFVDVGIQGNGSYEGVHAGEIAEYMAKHEFGWDGMPARSFMRPAIDENRERLQRLGESLYRQVLAQRLTKKQAYEQLGLRAQTLIKKKILSGIDPPNAPSTVRQKSRRQKGKVLLPVRTLVDRGAGVSSIHYEIKTKEKL